MALARHGMARHGTGPAWHWPGMALTFGGSAMKSISVRPVTFPAEGEGPVGHGQAGEGLSGNGA
jgi:hypothetical protein